MSEVKNENYISIQGWMVNELNLKGNELLNLEGLILIIDAKNLSYIEINEMIKNSKEEI